MADAAVGSLYKKLCQLLIREAELPVGAKDELQSIAAQLKQMRSFLNDFGWVRHENQFLEVLVKEIRDWSYDVEDVIDEYVAIFTNEDRSGQNKQSYNSESANKLIRGRNIDERSKDIKNRIEAVCAKKEKLGIEEIQHGPEIDAEGMSWRQDRRAPTPIVEEADMVGFADEVQTLVKQLTDGDLKRLVICIVGKGGLGKTTLANKIYKDSSVKDHFRYRAWACVSEDYTIEGILLSILKCLTNVTEDMKEMNKDQLGKVLHNQLKGKKYLIVMDDIWEVQVWKYLSPFLPDDFKGSRILFTTRFAEVAMHASDRMNPPHHLRLLDEEERQNRFKSLLGTDYNSQHKELRRRISERPLRKSGRRRAPPVEGSDIVGFVDEAQKLVKRLTEGGLKRVVIPIIGMGGLGKTTLAKKIYNDPVVKETFRYRAWIYVSQENTPEGILLGILKCLTIVTDKMKEMGQDELGKILQSQLKGKKYLIVMDDVWEPEVWKYLRPFLPDDFKGSRILFTTRVRDVALHASHRKNDDLFYLHPRNAQESWELFCKKALQGENSTPQWEEYGRPIAEKCCGLPLAIVIIGSLLSQKRRGYNEWSRSRVTKERRIYEEWSRIASDVSSFLFDHSAECKEIFTLSYNELPYYLKPCFLYFSAFPEDYQVSARQLIQLWVAEGFVKENREGTMEDTADRYLDMLVNRGLVQVVQRRSDGGVKTCRIHSLLRDLCISEAQQERFLQVDGFTHSPSLNNPRRLAGNADTVMHILKDCKNVGKLRSLLCFTHVSGTPQAWSDLFKTINSLRIFKVSNVGTFPHEVENLIHLRYVGLDKNTLLQIPPSICNLLNLQVLDVRSKFIRSAPVTIWKLKKLRHLYFQGPTLLPPPNDGDHTSLEDLQTLSTISAESCTSQVFRKMPNLLTLGVIVKGHLNELSENLVKLKHLLILKLIGAAHLPPLIALPLKFPPILAKLTISDTQLQEDPMPLLGVLKNLQILKLVNNACTKSEMVCSAHGFPRLQLLKLMGLEYLQELIREEGALPELEHVVIHDCQRLQSFTGLGHLTTLQIVDLWNPTIELRRQMQSFKKKHQYQLHAYPLLEDLDE